MTDANSSTPEDDAQFESGDDGGASSKNNDWVANLLIRALFMIGFSFIAYITLWVLIVMAIVQFVVVCVQRETNSDLRKFSRNLVQYLFELFAFICFATEDRPFPFGAFPNVPD